MIQSTGLILASGVLICLALVVALCAVLIRMRRHAGQAAAGKECVQNQRTPLENLVAGDLSFVSKHPSLARTLARELRRERRKVLREYLRVLRSEFDRTCADIRAAMVNSAADRPDLAGAIFKQQFLFKINLMKAECAMVFEVFGLAEVNFEDIVETLSSIRFKVARLLIVTPNEAG